MPDMLTDLRNKRMRLDQFERDLAEAQSRVRFLKGEAKASQRKIDELLGELVNPRPLLDLVEAKEEAKEETSTPEPAAPAYTWESYPIEKLIGDRHAELVGLLIAEELGTVGALAEFLSNGDDLEEIEVPDDGQGDTFRKLNQSETWALRAALLKFIGEQGIAREFPLSHVDPTLDFGVYRVTFRGGKEPNSRRGVYLRATNYTQAADYAELYWPGRVLQVVAVPDRVIPDGSRVEMVPIETYQERQEKLLLEQRAQLKAEPERAAKKKALKPRKPKAASKAQPEASDDLFAVTKPRKKTPLLLIRATSLKATTEWVRQDRPFQNVTVAPWWEPMPKGVPVKDVTSTAPVAKGA